MTTVQQRGLTSAGSLNRPKASNFLFSRLGASCSLVNGVGLTADGIGGSSLGQWPNGAPLYGEISPYELSGLRSKWPVSLTSWRHWETAPFDASIRRV